MYVRSETRHATDGGSGSQEENAVRLQSTTPVPGSRVEPDVYCPLKPKPTVSMKQLPMVIHPVLEARLLAAAVEGSTSIVRCSRTISVLAMVTSVDNEVSCDSCMPRQPQRALSASFNYIGTQMVTSH